MAPLVTAVEFRMQLETGRNRPVVLSCVREDDSKAEYVVKLRAGMEAGVFGLAAELLSARLAEVVGLSTPTPAVVQIEAEFVNSLPNDVVRERLVASVGQNFGSENLSGGYTTWPRGKMVPRALRMVAGEILAFDVLIQNLDRRPARPNVLWSDEELVIIDHDLAFSFIFALANAEPWNDEFANGIRGHLFYEALRGNLESLDRFQGALEALAEDAIDGILAEIPDDWYGMDGRVQALRTYLLRRRDSAPRWLEAIRRYTA